jgi:hypothetical protein
MADIRYEKARRKEIVKNTIRILSKYAINNQELKREVVEMMEESELQVAIDRYNRLKSVSSVGEIKALVHSYQQQIKESQAPKNTPERSTEVKKEGKEQKEDQKEVEQREGDEKDVVLPKDETQNPSPQSKNHSELSEDKKEGEGRKRPISISQNETQVSIVSQQSVLGSPPKRIPPSSKIAGIVLDSPFTCSHRLVHEIMTTNMGVSSFTATTALFFVSRTIRSNVHFDVLGNNKPIDRVHSLRLPTLFLIGDNDTMINQNEFKKMFDNCESDHKSLRFLQNTGHPDCRNAEDIEFAINFLTEIEERLQPKTIAPLLTDLKSPTPELNDQTRLN